MKLLIIKKTCSINQRNYRRESRATSHGHTTPKRKSHKKKKGGARNPQIDTKFVHRARKRRRKSIGNT